MVDRGLEEGGAVAALYRPSAVIAKLMRCWKYEGGMIGGMQPPRRPETTIMQVSGKKNFERDW